MNKQTKGAAFVGMTVFAEPAAVWAGLLRNRKPVPITTAKGRWNSQDYRQWVYLTTGFDMSYNLTLPSMDHHMFDNVFVNPEAYQKFLETGTWPDKTVMVLEARMAEGKGSINQKGNYRGEVMAREVHVKDEARFPGKWAFFAFGDEQTGTLVPTTADCYSCHSEHGAVDTTFVQFYPTPIKRREGERDLEAAGI